MAVEHPIDWKGRTVIRILLIIAAFLSEGELKAEVKSLASHIQAGLFA